MQQDLGQRKISASEIEIDRQSHAKYQMFIEDLEVHISGYQNEVEEYLNSDRFEPAYELAASSVKRNSFYKFSVVESLAEGRTSGSTYPICFKSFDEGVEDILSHYMCGKSEHAWVFVPSIPVWLDVTSEINEGGVRSDNLIISTLARNYPLIETLHTHPPELYSWIADFDDEKEKGLTKESAAILAAIPSEIDILALFEREEFSGPEARIRGNIISQHGVTNYERTNFFRKTEKNARKFVLPYSEIQTANNTVSEIRRLCAMLQDDISSIQLSEGKTTPAWNVSFNPHKDRI